MARPVYLTPLEAAALLRVTRRTVYTWLRTGQLRRARVGGGWRIVDEDLMAFGRGHRHGTQPSSLSLDQMWQQARRKTQMDYRANPEHALQDQLDAEQEMAYEDQAAAWENQENQ